MNELLSNLKNLSIVETKKIDDSLSVVIFSDTVSLNIRDRLPEGCSIERVSEDDEFMKSADEMRFQSGCFKQQTGAVIVKDGKIISGGANEGKLHKFCARDEQGFKTGEGYHLCKEICQQFNHAERSALERALSAGNDTRGAKIYLSGHWWACALCWRWLIDSGITTLVLDQKADEKFKSPVSLFSANA